MTTRMADASDRHDLNAVLRRRGHVPLRSGNDGQTIWGSGSVMNVLNHYGQIDYFKELGRLSPGMESSDALYFDQFGINAVRKLLRSLCGGADVSRTFDELTRISGNATEGHLERLLYLQIVQTDGSEYRLAVPRDNIGPSLEQYVAHICETELWGSALAALTLEGVPRAGGDYDVVAWLDPSLVYIECKSAKPSAVTPPQVAHMLQRAQELAPQLCVLLIDTPNALDEVAMRIDLCHFGAERFVDGALMVPQPDYPGVWFGHDRQYLIGSEPSILRQLRRCLQHYYAHVNIPRVWTRTNGPLKPFVAP